MSKNLLIAEDNPDLRKIFAKAFEKTNFTIQLAEDGEDAIIKITQQLPDIIILDVDMPKLSGFDVMQYLHNTNRKTKIILVTGNSVASDAPEAEYADLVLVKPVSIHELVTLAKRFTGELE